ncbi:AAA family ATPase [Phytopseudomonas dryadis]|uniref:Histidine kinase n=1 Tax=Phytopseudomonas dryadis TaxID=2487520 RepID=A0A4Q9QZI3_9GAMM|nr:MULTISPECIES: histidine kinase [Pseudomonas]TBU90027.1 histidine kinase [Pseudomonas dryadis]TBV02663.1 histidine kinase [Pseudomonas dryadis]TBV15515.1 histidine kinase [Pseudomonas sp. FRB 230]
MNDTSLNTRQTPADLMLFAADGEQASHYGQHLARLGSTAAQARAGGLAAAIDWSRRHPSPEILLVDLDGDPLPLQSLAELSEVCDPACHIIALGGKQDVDLYRSLLHSGVFDYLLKPVSLDLLASTLARARGVGHGDPHGVRSGRTIAVTGSSGGCGTSTVVAGLGLLLSQQRHTATAVVDFDRSNGDQNLLLGYDGEAGLAGALSSSEIDTRLLQRAMGRINERLHLLAQAPLLRNAAAFDSEHLLDLGGNLCRLFNQVIWDLPAGCPPGSLEVLAHAQTRILLTDLSVQDARNLHRLLREIGDESEGQQLLVVANAARDHAAPVVERAQFEDFIERRIDLLLPHAGNALATSLLAGPLRLEGAPAFQNALLELADLATGHTPKRNASVSGSLIARLKQALNRQRPAA